MIEIYSKTNIQSVTEAERATGETQSNITYHCFKILLISCQKNPTGETQIFYNYFQYNFLYIKRVKPDQSLVFILFYYLFFFNKRITMSTPMYIRLYILWSIPQNL